MGCLFTAAPAMRSFTRTTALSNSMKLSHAHGATQDGRVMVERFERMWSTGEGNGKPLQYSCLENPINSMKRQKDRTLNDEMVFRLAKHLQGDGQPLERMCSFCCSSSFCCSYSQVGRHQIFYELNKGTSVYCGAEGQGPLRQAVAYNNNSNEKQVKETVPTGSLVPTGLPVVSSLQHNHRTARVQGGTGDFP